MPDLVVCDFACMLNLSRLAVRFLFEVAYVMPLPPISLLWFSLVRVVNYR